MLFNMLLFVILAQYIIIIIIVYRSRNLYEIMPSTIFKLFVNLRYYTDLNLWVNNEPSAIFLTFLGLLVTNLMLIIYSWRQAF